LSFLQPPLNCFGHHGRAHKLVFKLPLNFLMSRTSQDAKARIIDLLKTRLS
jgi:hypothetical protein